MQMSGRCGIPLSTLAKVEHDRLTLTYDKLLQVSQRLKIPVSELFAEPESDNEPAVTARRSIGRLPDAVRVKTRNYDYHYLCPELRRKRMIPVLARLRVKSLEEFGDLVRHSGEEYTYVLEGRVVLHTEFYDPLTLEVGESVYIDSNMGHAYVVGDGCREAAVLCLCSSSEEITHGIASNPARAERFPPPGGCEQTAPQTKALGWRTRSQSKAITSSICR